MSSIGSAVTNRIIDCLLQSNFDAVLLCLLVNIQQHLGSLALQVLYQRRVVVHRLEGYCQLELQVVQIVILFE